MIFVIVSSFNYPDKDETKSHFIVLLEFELLPGYCLITSFSQFPIGLSGFGSFLLLLSLLAYVLLLYSTLCIPLPKMFFSEQKSLISVLSKHFFLSDPLYFSHFV